MMSRKGVGHVGMGQTENEFHLEHEVEGMGFHPLLQYELVEHN
jgi:hypothetical protein